MSQISPGFLQFGAIGTQPLAASIAILAADSVIITNGVITLSNDLVSPTNGQFYGVSGGVRGWFFPSSTGLTATDSIIITGSNATLVGDVATPSNGQFYGYNGSARGWFTPPIYTSADSILLSAGNFALVNDVLTPTNGQFYGYSGGARGWFVPAGTTYTSSDSILLTSGNFALVNDVVTPSNGQFYGYSGGARGWFAPSAGITASDSIVITTGNATLVNDVATPSKGQYYGYRNSARGWAQPTFLNILDYGGDNTGTNDNSTAFSSSFSALPKGGGIIFFPAGNYKFTASVSMSLAAHSTLSLMGEGPEVTKLFWTTAQSTGAIQINFASNLYCTFNISSLAFTTQVAGGGIALSLTGATSQFNEPQNIIHNCSFRGDDAYAGTDYWNTCIKSLLVSNLNVVNSIFVGGNTSAGYATASSGTGIDFMGYATGPVYAVICNLTGSTFNYLTYGFIYDTYSQGVSISQCNFTGCYIGINIPSTAVGLAQLTVSCSQFNTLQQCVSILAVVNAFSFTGNNLYVSANTSGILTNTGISMYLFSISHNVFIGLSTTLSYGILMAAATAGTISDNVFYNLDVGIGTQAGCSNLIIHDNLANANCTTGYSLAGTTINQHSNF